MIWQYAYIFAADLLRYKADGWKLCGPMKGKRYAGGHPDTVIARRRVERFDRHPQGRQVLVRGPAGESVREGR